jgi:hypothetical protein
MRWRRSGSCGTVAAVLLLEIASPARGQDPDTAPSAATSAAPEQPARGPRTDGSWLNGLFVAGTAVFGLSWGFALFTDLGLVLGRPRDSCDDCLSRAALLSVPLAGPALVGGLAEHVPPPHWPYYAWSGAETVGAAMAIAGLLIGRHDASPRPRDRPPPVTVVPFVDRRSSGVTVGLGW